METKRLEYSGKASACAHHAVTGARLHQTHRMPSGIPTEKTNLVNIVAKAIPTVNDGKVTHTKHNLTVCSFNPRSVKNKTLSLSDFILSHDLDIVALTETWLGCAVDNVCIGELVPPGYRMESVPRQDGRQGGVVAVLHRSDLSLKILNSTSDKLYNTFEHMDCEIEMRRHKMRLGVVYRRKTS